MADVIGTVRMAFGNQPGFQTEMFNLADSLPLKLAEMATQYELDKSNLLDM